MEDIGKKAGPYASTCILFAAFGVLMLMVLGLLTWIGAVNETGPAVVLWGIALIFAAAGSIGLWRMERPNQGGEE